jgi:hypothetical protein
VFGHPAGPRAGAASLRQAWEAVASRTGLAEYARGRPELLAAIEAFGGQGRGLGEEACPASARGFTGAPIVFQPS